MQLKDIVDKVREICLNFQIVSSYLLHFFITYYLIFILLKIILFLRVRVHAGYRWVNAFTWTKQVGRFFEFCHSDQTMKWLKSS